MKKKKKILQTEHIKIKQYYYFLGAEVISQKKKNHCHNVHFEWKMTKIFIQQQKSINNNNNNSRVEN